MHFTVQAVRVNYDGDCRSLELIAVQLILNALKFSEATVQIAFGVEDHVLVMTLRDQGIGIAQEEQSEIFALLARGSNLHKQQPGTEVGLTVETSEVFEGKIVMRTPFFDAEQHVLTVGFGHDPHAVVDG